MKRRITGGGSRSITRAAFAALVAMTSPAHAIFAVTEPWVRADANGQTAEAFMKVRSTDAAALVGVDSFAARSVTIRTGADKSAAAKLDLPANVIVELKPNETRIRLTGLVRRLKMGEYVPLTLSVRTANGNEQKHFINAEVRRRSPTEDEAQPHGHHSHKH